MSPPPWLAGAPPVLLLLGAAISLRTSTPPRIARGLALLSILLAALATAALFRSGRTGESGTLDGDPLSLYFTGLVLASILFALLARAEEMRSIGRLLATGALAVVAVSTRDLLWAFAALELFLWLGWEEGRPTSRIPAFAGLFPLAALGLLYAGAGGVDLAVVAGSSSTRPLLLKSGLVLFEAGLVAVWILETRRLLRSSTGSFVLRTTTSFVLLASVLSALARIELWLPSFVPLGFSLLLSLVLLGLGAFGMLGATRVSTFVTGLALARAGLAVAPLAGGLAGLSPFLLELAAGGISLLLVAFAVEGFLALDELEGIVSRIARFCLLMGAFSASLLPPFPGFVAAFPLASALLAEGQRMPLAAISGLAFVAGLGSLRLVKRAFSSSDRHPGGAPAPGTWAGLGLALAAGWFFSIAPGYLIELAAAAVRGAF